MIKFFRHIRRQLLRENRFTRYLIYAIGEIILVVIGILIALQVNNWNEQRKVEKAEVKYIMALRGDLKRDLYAQDSIINFLQKKIQNLEVLANELRNERQDINYKNAFASYTSSLGFPDFIANDHTLETLKSSGNIEAISNERIRAIILDYYDDVEVYYRTQEGVNNIMITLMMQNHVFNLNLGDDLSSTDNEHLKNIGQAQITAFSNQVIAYYLSLQDVSGRLKKLKIKNKRILDAIAKNKNLT